MWEWPSRSRRPFSSASSLSRFGVAGKSSVIQTSFVPDAEATQKVHSGPATAGHTKSDPKRKGRARTAIRGIQDLGIVSVPRHGGRSRRPSLTRRTVPDHGQHGAAAARRQPSPQEPVPVEHPVDVPVGPVEEGDRADSFGHIIHRRVQPVVGSPVTFVKRVRLQLAPHRGRKTSERALHNRASGASGEHVDGASHVKRVASRVCWACYPQTLALVDKRSLA